VQIIPPSERNYFNMTFSPDGNFVYYTTLTGPGTGALYQIPALGGAERRLLDDVVWVSVSPNGARLAVVRGNSAAGESSILVANPDGTGERRLVTRKLPDDYQNIAWSPDGRTIATLVRNRTSRATHIVLIDPENGKERDLGAPGFTVYGYGLEWLPEGFLLTGAEPNTNALTNYSQVWMVAYPGGKARRITHDLNLYSQLSATADGRTIVADQDSYRANIWTMSLDDPQGARQITFGRRAMDGSDGLDWAPDGRLVYTSFASGSADVWSMKSDGSEPRQLTFDPGWNRYPAVSTDGRFIVFRSDRSGVSTLWRMDIDGGNARQLTSVRVVGSGSVLTPDGTWAVYSQADPGTGTVTNWKVPVDGGESVPLFKSAAQPTESGATAPPAHFWARAISADGRWVAGEYMEANAFARRLVLVSADGTEPRRELSAMPSTTAPTLVSGTRDGRALLYVRTGGVSNLWLQPLDGSAPRQLTSFAREVIYSFALSDDGRTLAVSRGEATTDLVMITSEEKK
jgi:Tol biopolymer transport system component